MFESGVHEINECNLFSFLCRTEYGQIRMKRQTLFSRAAQPMRCRSHAAVPRATTKSPNQPSWVDWGSKNKYSERATSSSGDTLSKTFSLTERNSRSQR